MEKMIYHGSDHIIEQDSTALKIQIWQKNGTRKKRFVINLHAVNILIPNETTDNGGIYISPLFWMRR